MSEPRVAYPFWVAMGAAFVGTLLGGSAVWIGLSDRLDAAEQRAARAEANERTQGPEPERIDLPVAETEGSVRPPTSSEPVQVIDGGLSADPGDSPLVRAVARTRDSVVNLLVDGRARGAGVVYDERGLVLTNYHVIEPVLQARSVLGSAQPGERLLVSARFEDGREREAEILAADPDEDIAVLRLVPTLEGERFNPVAVGRSAGLRLGEQVFAIGSPVGFENTVASGIVSALARTGVLANRQIPLIQLDAAINLGSSGGPLFNLRGELVGITTARSSRGEGIGFAIPIDRVRLFLRALSEGEPLRAGMIGVELDPVADITPTIAAFGYRSGIAVARVVPDGPAAVAGVETSDVIVELRGRRHDEFDASPEGRAAFGRLVSETVRSLLPGETLTIEVIRGSTLVELELTIEATTVVGQARIDAEELLGVFLGSGEQPVIAGLVPGSPISEVPGAAQALRDAQIVEILGHPVTTVEELGERLDDLRSWSASGGRRSIAITFVVPGGKRIRTTKYPLATRR